MDNPDVGPGQHSTPTAMSSIAEWAAANDRADIADAPSGDMAQQIIAEDGMRQDDAGENQGKERVNGD